MTNQEQIPASWRRLGFLTSGWSQKREQIILQQARLSALGAPEGMKPSAFKKFLKLLGQVSTLTREEEKIVDEISEIEEKHRIERQGKHLRSIDDVPPEPKGPALEGEEGAPAPKRDKPWLMAALFWFLNPLGPDPDAPRPK